MIVPKCRFCGAGLQHTFVDLGVSPLANAYVREAQLDQMEAFYPLHARVCSRCFLVQVDAFQSPNRLFEDYAYFSSFSESWLRHAEDYAREMTRRFCLDERSLVIEIASNDGYLLQYFHKSGIPVLGIEPAKNVARAAEARGIPTLTKFFGASTATELRLAGPQADLIVANNVIAHVPDLRDFVAGFQLLLKPEGVLTIEFPHLLRLIENNEFDTIYHEHFSYFSLLTMNKVLAEHGLRVFDVEELSTHGGSLRVYACHREDMGRSVADRVDALRDKEEAAGLSGIGAYTSFSARVFEVKRALLECLIAIKQQGKTIAAYGAPAKGNTLLNFCGIGRDFLDYAVDQSPHKQGLFLPGTRIPISPPERLTKTKPDYVLILPWNLKDEIVKQMAHVRNWGGQFIIPIPRVQVLS